MTERGVRVTLEESGLPIAASTGMLAKRAYNNLLIALSRLRIQFMVDVDDTGAVVFRTDDGCRVICAVFGTMDGQGEVKKIGDDYILSLTSGLLSTLLDFTGSAWANANLLRSAQECSRSMEEIYPPVLPGFERFLLRRVPVDGDPHAVPFVSAFSAATEFCWLHELSHVLLGHCDSVEGPIALLESNDANARTDCSNRAKRNEADFEIESPPYLYMEMQADQFALSQVMSGAYDDYLTQSADDIRVFAAYIGCLALPITCYVQDFMNRVQSGETESTDDSGDTEHPPFYVRAAMARRVAYQTLVKAFENASRRDLGNHRDRYERFNERALSVLSDRHPWYGDFSRALSDEADYYLEQYIAEQAALAAPWSSRFKQNVVAPGKLTST